MIWPKTTITINKQKFEAIAPILISASRATDIPAFYAKPFIECLKKGYLYWTNPFNGKKSLISLTQTKLIAFWTKNPISLLPYLDEVKKSGIDFYFNYTLNDYENEGFEELLPPLNDRIETFIKLSRKIGKENVIWRFDPVIIDKNQDVEVVLKRIGNIAEQLKNHTNKLVFSFVDTKYRKVQAKLKRGQIQLFQFTDETKHLFAEKLSHLLNRHSFNISTCAEPIDFSKYGITHNKCIDNELIVNNFPHNKGLITFIKSLEAKGKLRDNGQRSACQCIVSKDIGRYNTCGYGCVYCYAMQKESPAITNDIFS